MNDKTIKFVGITTKTDVKLDFLKRQFIGENIFEILDGPLEKDKAESQAATYAQKLSCKVNKTAINETGNKWYVYYYCQEMETSLGFAPKRA